MIALYVGNNGAPVQTAQPAATAEQPATEQPASI